MRLLPLLLAAALAGCAPAGMAPPPPPEDVTLRASVRLDNGAAAVRDLLAFTATPAANPLRPGLNNGAAGTAWGLADVKRVDVKLFRVTTEEGVETRIAPGTALSLDGGWGVGTQGLTLTGLRRSARYKLVLAAYGDDGYASYTQARAPEPDADAKAEGVRRVDAAYATPVATLEAATTGGNVVYFDTTNADYFTLGTIALPLRTKNFVGDAEGGTVQILPGTVTDPADSAASIAPI